MFARGFGRNMFHGVKHVDELIFADVVALVNELDSIG